MDVERYSNKSNTQGYYIDAQHVAVGSVAKCIRQRNTNVPAVCTQSYHSIFATKTVQDNKFSYFITATSAGIRPLTSRICFLAPTDNN